MIPGSRAGQTSAITRELNHGALGRSATPSYLGKPWEITRELNH